MNHLKKSPAECGIVARCFDQAIGLEFDEVLERVPGWLGVGFRYAVDLGPVEQRPTTQSRFDDAAKLGVRVLHAAQIGFLIRLT